MRKSLKLKLPSFPKISTGEIFSNLLGWLEKLILVITIGGLLLNVFPQPKLDVWVTGITLVLAMRIIRGLVFSVPILPATRWDLVLLTNLTLVLVAVVVQTDNDSVLSLGGNSIWSIGVILLRAITVYLLFVNLGSKLFRKIALWGILALVILMQISSNNLGQLTLAGIASSGKIYLLQLPIIGTFLLLGWLVGSKRIISKVIALLLLVWQLLSLVNSFYIPNLIILAISLLFVGGLIALLARQNVVVSLRKPRSIYGWIIILLGLIALVATVAAGVTNPQFARYVEALANSFTQTFARLTDFRSLVAGVGLSSSGTSVQGLFLGYGLLGLLGEIILVFALIAHVARQYKAKWTSLTLESAQITIVFGAFIFMSVSAVLGVIDIFGLIMTMLLGTYLFATDYKIGLPKNLEKVQDAKQDKTQSKLSGFMNSDALKELKLGVKVVLIAALIVYLPTIIAFLQNLL